MLEIRPFVPADAGALSALLESLGYPTSPEEVLSRIGALPAGFYRTLVAAQAGAVTGFIGLAVLPIYENPRPIGWILALSVDPGRQRQGIGRALVEAAERHFRERNVESIRVNSGLQREDAHRFYQSMGYLKTGYRFRKPLA